MQIVIVSYIACAFWLINILFSVFFSRAVATAAMSGVKISFRVLWQFVSEHSPLKPRSQIQRLLEENEEFIRDSLSIYAEGKVSGIVHLTS